MKRIYIPYVQLVMVIIVSMWIISTHAEWVKPHFAEDGSIKLVSRALSCGSVLIKPRVDKLTPEAGYADAYLRLRSVPFLTDYQPQKTLGMVILGPEGLRAKFGWGKAFRKFSHYRIYCEKINISHAGKEVIQPVKCKDVVTLEHINMNMHCGPSIIPGAAGGRLNPLNME